MTTPPTAEDHLAKLGLHLPEAPTPFGVYVPAVQTGNFRDRLNSPVFEDIGLTIERH
jgi:hypothetical protein